MTQTVIRIGTRDSKLALWQAETVSDLLQQAGYTTQLVPVKSEGDLNLTTPLYEMGVQGIFTRSLDIALLNNQIDIAVHSMKDVPTQLPHGIVQAAVLQRGNNKDLLVLHPDKTNITAARLQQPDAGLKVTIATSSIRRKAQWQNRYPNTIFENLRGNVHTRMEKLQNSHWDAAIFAAAGLERVGLRPSTAIEIDWMLPAPAQGAIMIVGRENDTYSLQACIALNDEITAFCTQLEKDFLRTLMGGCTTPISALARLQNGHIHFTGSLLSVDGLQKIAVEKQLPLEQAAQLGVIAANEILQNGGKAIVEAMK
jgi:hydroxymethylbilane synthase